MDSLKGKPWDRNDKLLLRKLHAEGLSDASLAQRMDRTVWSVANCRRRLGLRSNNPRPPRADGTAAPLWTAAEEAILSEGHARGEPDRVIAARLPGRSVNAIRIHRQRLNATAKPILSRTQSAASTDSYEQARAEQRRAIRAELDPDNQRAQRIAEARAQNDARRQAAFEARFGRAPTY